MVEETDLPIETATGSYPIGTSVFVNVDLAGRSDFRVSDTRDDLKMSLFVSEEFGRYISGICNPLLGPNCDIEGMIPLVDDEETRGRRKQVIEEIYDMTLRKIESGSFERVCEYTDSVRGEQKLFIP